MAIEAKAIMNPSNPKESPRVFGGAVPVPICLAVATNIEKISATAPTTATTGKIKLIKLAINPNFLLDSSAIPIPSIAIV